MAAYDQLPQQSEEVSCNSDLMVAVIVESADEQKDIQTQRHIIGGRVGETVFPTKFKRSMRSGETPPVLQAKSMVAQTPKFGGIIKSKMEAKTKRTPPPSP